jgi:hypothetical protein
MDSPPSVHSEPMKEVEEVEKPQELEREKSSLRKPDEALENAAQAQTTEMARLAEQSQDLNGADRVVRKLTVKGVEIHPPLVTPGGRAVAIAHATVQPPFEQSTKMNVRARVMRNLVGIAEPISQVVTIPAGGGTWKITIPIKIPAQVLSGDCYVEIDLWDPSQQVKGSRKIGFTIR